MGQCDTTESIESSPLNVSGSAPLPSPFTIQIHLFCKTKMYALVQRVHMHMTVICIMHMQGRYDPPKPIFSVQRWLLAHDLIPKMAPEPIFSVQRWLLSPCSQSKHGCLRLRKRSDLYRVLIGIFEDVKYNNDLSYNSEAPES